MFKAGGVTGAPPNLTMEDLNVVVNDGAKILEDPAAAANAHGIGVAKYILPKTSAARALRAPNTTLH